MVRDDGSLNAPIFVVGEAPGREEMAKGYPFAGPSGNKLSAWLRLAGLDRSKCYVSNVLRTIPQSKGGDINAAIKLGTVTREDIESGYARLHDTAGRMPNLKAIVAVGNYAAHGFTGLGKVSWSTESPGITSIRGSVYDFTTPHGQKCPVVPCIHPAAVLRQPAWEKRCIRDWQRVARIIEGDIPRAPERNYIINPTYETIQDWIHSRIHPDQVVAVDIETWGGIIRCVGMATRVDEALVIPTTDSYWGDKATSDMVWKAIAGVISDPQIEICMQGGLFDAWWFEEYGIPVEGYYWDTLAMHHALDPVESHSLEFLASVYTGQRYWKDEAKQAEDIVRIAKSVGMDRLYVYNGIDCCVEYELFELFYDTLDSRGMLRFYLDHYADMHKPLLKLSRNGVRVDIEKMNAFYREYVDRAIRLRDEAFKHANRPLVRFNQTKCERDMLELYWLGLGSFYVDGMPKDELFVALEQKGHKLKTIEAKWQALQQKGISDRELGKLLFDEWKAPRGAKTETGRDALGNVPLKTLKNKVEARKRYDRKEDVAAMVDRVIAHRRNRTLSSFCDTKRVDADGRLRAEYRFTTKSGRLASRENPKGTGANLQNYDRTLKGLFIPKPDRYLVNVDLSQAEGRVVKALSGADSALESARRLPTEGDEHTENAAAIFSVLENRPISLHDVTYDQRQIGKRVVHAVNYHMGRHRLIEVLLKEGYVITLAEAGTMLKAQLDRCPYIPVYHARVRRRMLQHQQLYTSWGRYIYFDHIRLDDEAFKFGYSVVPQSEVGDLTNQYGLKPLDRFIQENKMDSEIVLQVHDSLVIDAPTDEIYAIMSFLNDSLSKTRTYGGCFDDPVELSIPCEFGIGKTAKMSHEWKSLPTPSEVFDAIVEIREQSKVAA